MYLRVSRARHWFHVFLNIFRCRRSLIFRRAYISDKGENANFKFKMGSVYPQNPTQNSLMPSSRPPPSHLTLPFPPLLSPHLPSPDLALLKLVRYKPWFSRSFVKGVGEREDSTTTLYQDHLVIRGNNQ